MGIRTIPEYLDFPLALVFTSWIFIRINVHTAGNYSPLLFNKRRKKKKKETSPSRQRHSCSGALFGKMIFTAKRWNEDSHEELNDFEIQYELERIQYV